MSLKNLTKVLETAGKFVENFNIDKATEKSENEVFNIIETLSGTESDLFAAQDEINEKLQEFIYLLGQKDFSKEEKEEKKDR